MGSSASKTGTVSRKVIASRSTSRGLPKVYFSNGLSSRPQLLIPEGDEKRSGGTCCFLPAQILSGENKRFRLASGGYASGLKHPLDARVHLFLFDKFPSIGLRDAFSHGGTKPRVLFKQAQDRILYQSLGIRTGTAGDLR